MESFRRIRRGIDRVPSRTLGSPLSYVTRRNPKHYRHCSTCGSKKMTKVSSVDSTPQPPKGAKSRVRLSRRVRGFLALPVAALILSGCTVPSFGAYESNTETGRSTYHLWQGFSIAAAIIGGLTLLLILWAVVRYRRKSVDAIPKQTQYHLPLEWFYTIVPILIVFGLFAATVVVENKVTAEPKPAVTVDVQAVQWGWSFSYPGTNALITGQTTQAPMFEIPAGENVHFVLNSTDVVHGFYLRDFNFSRLAIPGIANQWTFNAINTGEFFGQCTELCGLYHSIMYFRVKVVTPSEFKAWVAKFNTPEGARAAEAAALASKQQLSSIIPTRPTTNHGVN